jgi:sigma-B regulation protein RsbU (phosphoserine phosphatase)
MCRKRLIENRKGVIMTGPVNDKQERMRQCDIDDDPTSVVVLEGMLNKEGIGTFYATGGAEGRSLVKAEHPDLVLLDIYMPDESGFDTCRIIKDDPETADIPIIFITSKTDAPSKLKGFELGAVDYITKPYLAAEVMARVRVHIRLRQSVRSYLEAQVSRLRQLTEAQEAFLLSPQDLPEAGFAVAYRPAHEVGGDFYDVIHSGEGLFDYIVADVSAHDLGASLATSALKALLHQGKSALYTPLETIRMTNQVVFSAFPREFSLSMAYTRLNRRKGLLSLICAGHPDMLLLRRDGETSGSRPGEKDWAHRNTSSWRWWRYLSRKVTGSFSTATASSNTMAKSPWEGSMASGGSRPCSARTGRWSWKSSCGRYPCS